jgi:MFS family permease
MGKIADVFGRLESFSITIFLYTIGYIQQAASQSVEAYASAQIFWAAGFNGLQILQQIFVADTTDLLNRALFSTLFDVPFLWTVWAGPPLGAKILADTTWRWGYGIWAIILPVCFVPLAVSLIMNQQRAKRLGLYFPSALHGRSVSNILKNLWYDLDLFGLLLFAAAISLILLPLTLAPNASREWRTPSMIAMLAIGGVLLLCFPFWETNKKLAPKAFFPPNLFRKRTVIAGILIAFFYFSESRYIVYLEPSQANPERSGFLYECFPLLLLIPSHCAERVDNFSWLHHSSLLVYLNRVLDCCVPHHQVHGALQVLRYVRRMHLLNGHVSTTSLERPSAS